MKVIQKPPSREWIAMVPETVPDQLTQEDRDIFAEVTSTHLTREQEERILSASQIFPRQKCVLGIHWHPEFIPMALIAKRIAAMFPNQDETLVIPTQHNQLMSHGPYTGVEVDCYSSGFNQKVQLLLHFANQHIQQADRLKAMLAHTFKYRSSQLFEFIHTLIKPVNERIGAAARQTGADEKLVQFTQAYTRKISDLLDEQADTLPPEMIKNKILRNFFDRLRPRYGEPLIDRVQTFLKAVKMQVKADFSLQYFYRASEVIEEARALNAGIVVPHPEQFWPILLADYDVDGYEVWNPQSQRYTEFLIDVITRQNKGRGASRTPLLIFMGDDTHMGEKVRDDALQDTEKINREIGLQPAWDDMGIRKALIRADIDRRRVIRDYRSRLDG